MKDNWLNDLDKKVQNGQEQAPENLWESISDRLFDADSGKVIPLHPNLQQEAVPKANKRSVIRLIWGGTAIVTAALVLVFLYPVFYPTQPPADEPILSQHSEGINSELPGGEGLSQGMSYSNDMESHHNETEQAKLKNGSSDKIVKNSYFAELPALTKLVGWDNGFDFENNTIKPLEMVLQNRVFNPTHSDRDDEVLVRNNENYERLAMDNLYADNSKIKNKLINSGRWSIAAYSNRMRVSSGQNVSGYASMSGAPVTSGDYPLDGENGGLMSDIIEANSAENVTTDIQHRSPVALGLGLQYRVNKKMSLNIGLTYAQTVSTLSSGSAANKVAQSQKLNYIGVPVQVSYKVWQKKRVSTYVTGGAAIEKSTSGRITNEFVLDDNVRATDQELLKASPVQFSVNAGVGIETQLTRKIGLYLEPGIRYNMDNNSTVQTIYNQKPVNFNLNIGFRIPLP
ncbi:outer membrane beta-barrel protein [Sphingobacterium yanglingense]|uniref:Outer membrane protein with beta-barrel domain n=1 Tax=Sphingobacterium yanglingense TaxID=1437280 RepID=A0A4V3DDA6_9SPHI|nr:outer membrane beta-barrel protein [Sphingobacterium yanglingense]TDQ75421.1 outer membrane protein with beta-barrel domain [Sphingobacterium yanglingense]